MRVKILNIIVSVNLFLLYIVSITQCKEFCDLSKNQLQDFSDALDNVEESTITRLSGSKVGDKLNSLTCGRYGPVLLQDTLLLEELRQFDSERIPERAVHAKGGGAFGTFTVTHPDVAKYSKASVFSEVGKKTPVFTRFSTLFGEWGSADTVREVRGFAVKFYTDDGIWDFVGNNFPVAAVRDPIRFASFVHSRKRNPKTHLHDTSSFWDFVSLQPETLHQLLFSFSDRGIPDGFRFMHGFSINAFKLVNAQSEAVYCKFHFLTKQGIKNLDPDVAQQIAGEDADYAIRDLYNAIESSDYPSWTLYVQIMTFEEARNWYSDPFDSTKVWPHHEFPLIEIGQLILNRNPDNYFAQVEQCAFDPANLPPGIEPSPDIELHGRLFVYLDTQRHRLGANFQKIPINKPLRQTITPTLRDGHYIYNGNMDGAPNYYPNSYSKSRTDYRFKEHRFRVTNIPDVDRYESSDEDNYSQPRIFWESTLKDKDKQKLVKNIADHLKDAHVFIQKRSVAILSEIHIDLGTGVWKLLQQMNTTVCS